MKGLRAEDLSKMSKEQRVEKLKELRIELVKSTVAGKSPKMRTKEIKKAIARLLTVTRIGKKSPSVTAH